MKSLRIIVAALLISLLCLLPVYAEEASAIDLRSTETKGVFLRDGQDFDASLPESECKDQLNKALDQAVRYGMNSVYIVINSQDGALFKSKKWPARGEFDVLEYVLAQAKEKELCVYAVVDALYGKTASANYGSRNIISADFIRDISAAFSQLASQYRLDGIYLANFCNTVYSGSMQQYRREGASMGFDNWVRECATSLVVNASQSTKSTNADMLFGIICEPVWANLDTDARGSDTSYDFEMLTDGYVDLNAIGSWAKIDDMMILCPGSLTDDVVGFKTVINWWAEQAKISESSVTAAVFNHKLGGKDKGWKAPDQIMRQVIAARETEVYRGAAFTSLDALEKNYGGSTDVLVRFFENEIETQDILTDLAISKPEKRTYTTREPQAIFYGASDPNFPLKINGKELERNGEGVFSAEMDLQPGLNVFKFEHKEKTITYKITREVVIINGVSPAGSITVGGGTQIGISVMAYSGSTVTASLGGSTVNLVEEELADDSADGNTSSYVPFKGSISVPAGAESEQDIGSISVQALWEEIEQNASGAHVFVAAVPKQAPAVEGEKGVLAEITAPQARTYPGGILTNDPYGNCFPLPAGTVDYIVSDKLTYDDDYGHGEYFVLGSGLRVRAGDVTNLGEAEWELSSLESSSSWTDDQFVYVGFARAGRKTAYTVEFPGVTYSSDGGAKAFGSAQMRITLKDTQLNTAAPELAGNNLLSGVELTQSGNDTVINFNLIKAGSFLGYRAYYDGDTLVFRFNQIPSGLSGAKIYLDPGHGGIDSGASIPGVYTERDVNADLAARTAQILRDRGAIVQVTDTSGSVSLNSRIEMSQSFNPHLFVSIHFNSGVSSARGTEAYYFNPYSKLLAANTSANIANALETRNRGDKYGAYRVTTHMEFPAILMEGGFLTNPEELSKIQSEQYKNAMANALANAVQSTIESMH